MEIREVWEKKFHCKEVYFLTKECYNSGHGNDNKRNTTNKY